MSATRASRGLDVAAPDGGKAASFSSCPLMRTAKSGRRVCLSNLNGRQRVALLAPLDREFEVAQGRKTRRRRRTDSREGGFGSKLSSLPCWQQGVQR